MAWIGALVGVAGAALSSDSARKAGNQGADASAAAVAEQRRQYDQTRNDYSPYRQAGYGALAQLAQSYGLQSGGQTFQPQTLESFDSQAYLAQNPDVAAFVNDPNNIHGIRSAWDHYDRFGRDEGRKFTSNAQPTTGTPAAGISPNPTGQDVLNEDPGYAFGLQQGQQAIDRKIAAGGGRVSGAAIKAAGQFGTNYASTKYGEAYNRRQDRLNRLAAIAGLGQTATAGGASAGSNSANAISGILQNQGDYRAAGSLAQGNIWGGAVNQIGAAYGRQKQGGGGGGVPVDEWSGAGYY